MRQSTDTQRGRRVAAFVVGTILIASACGNASESGIEKLIEEQSGGDVDVDLDSDGGFSVQTEDGSMTIDENGNFVVTDENGETITGQANDDEGGFSVESEDGEFTTGATTELPDEWPQDVPEPDGLAISSATVIGGGEALSVTVSGTVEGSEFVDSYGSALESTGFPQESTFESGDMINRTFVGEAWTIGISFVGDGTDDQVTVTVFSTS
jgi:hypothetical protein